MIISTKKVIVNHIYCTKYCISCKYSTIIISRVRTINQKHLYLNIFFNKITADTRSDLQKNAC